MNVQIIWCACTLAPSPAYNTATNTETGEVMAGDGKLPSGPQSLIAKIVSSYVSHHTLAPEQLPELIALVHRSIEALGKTVEAPAALIPAVPVRRSVQREAVICLDCGWKGKMLRRHLTTRHHLSGEQYLQRWSLP